MVIETAAVRAALAHFRREMGDIAVRYAVKANPHSAVLRTIAEEGAGFDIASGAELEAALAAGATGENVVFAAPIKSILDIRAAHQAGVMQFVVDCPEELAKVARHAPGASILVRAAVSNHGSVFDLSRKFGANSAVAESLLRDAEDVGLKPVGLTFHVGSQALDVRVWRPAIRAVGAVLESVRADEWNECFVDIGGGFPACYDSAVPELSEIASEIQAASHDHLPGNATLVAEPGRLLVAEAGTLFCTVIGTASRGNERWAYLDAGVFSGAFETLPGQGEFKFPVYCTTRSGGLMPWVVAGPTCDGLDRLTGTALLPADLTEGDQVAIQRVGAYSSVFATEFCGWPRPQVIPCESLRDAATPEPTSPSASGVETSGLRP